MNPLLDGWLVMQRHLPSVLAFGACMLWGSIVIAGSLRSIVHKDYQAVDYFSLAMGGWILPVLIVSILFMALGTFLNVRPGLGIAAALLALSAAWVIWSGKWGRPGNTDGGATSLVILAAILAASLLLRLAFVISIPLPLYFDSAEHYRIIQSLMRDYGGRVTQQTIAWPVATYYHIGYHLLLAVVTSISQTSLVEAILISGQIVLAAVPLALFFMVHRETGSKLAGVLGVVLGAIGWYMPSHALNWGKYPALFALPAILFTLNLAYVARARAKVGLGARRLWAMAFLGTCVAFLIHTRSIIVVALACSAWALAEWWQGRPTRQRLPILAWMTIALIVVGMLVGRNEILNQALDPYLRSGIWITSLVALLAIPAFLKFPRLAFASLVTCILLLLCLFIPSPSPTFGTLLDRPLVEMVMFIPLSITGAAGFGAVTQVLKGRHALIDVGIAALVSLGIVLNAFHSYTFYPSTCCSIVAQDDLVAMDWIERNLPPEAHILIASAELTLAPSPYPPQIAAADAGVWILPLTDRQTSSLPYWTDFRQADTRDLVCGLGVTDIYASTTSLSFGTESLEARPDWYSVVLWLPRTRIYRILGCPG